MTAAAPNGFDRRLLAPLISGAVLRPINSAIIAVALVPIGVAFGEPASATAWLISSLYLATAVGQPVVGRLSDMYGSRRLFLPATALVGVAGVIGTLAPNLGVLVLARVILGFGTCAGYPAAMRLIRDESRRTDEDSPALVLTVLAISTQTISVIGPSLGGLLIGIGGWRTTFALNIPLALFTFVLGARRFPAQPRSREQKPLDLDLTGMALFAATLVALLVFLYRQANPDDIGASAGLLRTFGYLGAIISSAALGAFYGTSADTPGLRHLALMLIGIGVAFLLVTVLDRSLARRTAIPRSDKEKTPA